MTAEVAILNSNAVALAADSAMTVDGPRGTKIYNTVNKLFTLSKVEPVGIMVYSSAEVMALPVETVIKWFRANKLGDSARDTIQEYFEEFLSFLLTDSTVFPEANRERQAVRVADQVLMTIAERAYASRKQKPKDYALALLQDIDAQLQASSQLPGATRATARKVETLMARYLPDWLAYYKNAIGLGTVKSKPLIARIARDVVLRDGIPQIGDWDVPLGETGFVIAGFGEQEFMPSLRNFELISSVYGVNKYTQGNAIDITPDNNATIVPFAQKDMIETFVEGRSRAIDSAVGSILVRWFNAEIARLQKQPGVTAAQAGTMTNALTGIRDEVLKALFSELQTWTSRYHVEPLLETISALPKEELAVIAEALINLTIHKRRASPDAETVGPPTDVAVISKGDGFIWIKRKHYFEPALNPHFGHNYFRDVIP